MPGGQSLHERLDKGQEMDISGRSLDLLQPGPAQVVGCTMKIMNTQSSCPLHRPHLDNAWPQLSPASASGGPTSSARVSLPGELASPARLRTSSSMAGTAATTGPRPSRGSTTRWAGSLGAPRRSCVAASPGRSKTTSGRSCSTCGHTLGRRPAALSLRSHALRLVATDLEVARA